MGQGEIRSRRDKVVEGMSKTLDGVKYVGLSYWLCSMLMAPVFLGLVLWIATGIVWEMVKTWAKCVVKFLAAPFSAIWVFIDLVGISFWFLWQVVQKMSGGRK